MNYQGISLFYNQKTLHLENKKVRKRCDERRIKMTEQEKMLNERMSKRIHRSPYSKKKPDGTIKEYDRYYYSYDGKKYYFGTLVEAQESYKRKFFGEPEQVKAKETPRTDSTIETEIKKWFMDSYSLKKAASTKQRCHSIIKNQIIPNVGKKKILELSQKDVQAMCNACPSNSTSKKAFEYLQKFYREYHYLHYFEISPFEDINKQPHKSPEEAEPYTDEEVRRICEIAKQYNKYNYGFIFYLIAMTGIRIGEARAIRYKDFVQTRDGHSLKITENVSRGADYTDFDTAVFVQVIKDPKTESSIRTFPISEDVFEELARYKKISKLRLTYFENKSTKFIFENKNGNPANLKQLYKQWHDILSEAHISSEGRKVHELRHTFATRRVEEGANRVQLSSFLGHSDASITERIYEHTQPEALRSLINNSPMDKPRDKKSR